MARVIQGAGGGLITPQVSGFIQNMFKGPERGRAFGLFGASIGISTAIGPLLGGLLVQLGGPDVRLAARLLREPADRAAHFSCWRGGGSRLRAEGQQGRRSTLSGVLLFAVAMLLILLPGRRGLARASRCRDRPWWLRRGRGGRARWLFVAWEVYW